MKDQERSARSLELGTARVEAFSDAVMAVIITILAFQLQAPRGATLGAVRDQLPGLLVYVLSFVFVGIYWNNHHHLLRDEYRHALPAAAYGAVALGAGLAYAILVRALIRANGRESAVAKAIGSDLKGYASLVLDAAGVGLAFVSPWISYALYVAVSIMWFVPDRRFTRS
jgi:uncharacterized membrane protein